MVSPLGPFQPGVGYYNLVGVDDLLDPVDVFGHLAVNLLDVAVELLIGLVAVHFGSDLNHSQTTLNCQLATQEEDGEQAHVGAVQKVLGASEMIEVLEPWVAMEIVGALAMTSGPQTTLG